jgi:hypothetical protein
LYLFYPSSSSSAAAHGAHHAADTWLFLMQAIFDPLQGFFNAILFVFLSENDRQNIFYLFCLLPQSLCRHRPIISLEDYQRRRASHLHRNQPSPHPPLDDPSRPALFSGYQTKKKNTFFHRISSYLTSSSSSFSTSLISPLVVDGGAGGGGGGSIRRERAPQSSSQRSDSYLAREGAEESEEDHVGLSRISESATTARDSEGYHNHHPHRPRDASFVYDNESEFSVSK